MATQFFRRLFPKTLIYSRSLSTISFLRPLSAAVITSPRVILPSSFRSLSTRATILSLIEQASPPYATALKLRNGCDYYRRLVYMQSPNPGFFRGEEPTKDEITDYYVKKLAKIVRSEDEARMMVYSSDILSEETYSFGTLVPDELSERVEELPGVIIVVPDDPYVNEKNIDKISYPLDELEKYVRDAIARGEVI